MNKKSGWTKIADLYTSSEWEKLQRDVARSHKQHIKKQADKYFNELDTG